MAGKIPSPQVVIIAILSKHKSITPRIIELNNLHIVTKRCMVSLLLKHRENLHLFKTLAALQVHTSYGSKMATGEKKNPTVSLFLVYFVHLTELYIEKVVLFSLENY